MKKFTILFLLFTNLAFTQEFKKDKPTQEEVEFSNSSSGSRNIQSIDILEALDVLGVKIHKFDLGEFDKTYNLTITIEKFQEDRLIKKDTIFSLKNIYTYFDEQENAFYDYLSEIKIITHEQNEESKFYLITNGAKKSMKIDLPKSNDLTFFEWRKYKGSKWKLNKNTPLLIYASSWRDENYNIERFCGVEFLEENSEGEDELFRYSPNYAIISYEISE